MVIKVAIDKLKQSGVKTDSQIKQIIKEHTGGNDVYAVTGYKGLNIYIRDNKTTTFRHRFTSPKGGKRNNQTLGTYPVFTLEQARDKYRANLEMLSLGIDPMLINEQASLAVPTFEEFAAKWLDEQKASGLLEHRTIEQKRKHVEYANVRLGKMSIDAIKTPHVLKAIKEIERDTIPTAKRVRGVCQKIFALAIGEGYIESNPAIAVVDLMLSKPKTEHHVSIVEPEPFGKLLQDIYAVTDFYGHAQDIIKLQAMLFQRNQDMCSMRWADISFTAKTWAFKPSKTGNRGDMVSSLIVPLPRQAMAILERLHNETGDTPFVFYNKRRVSKFEHQQQLNKFLWRLGYKDIHTPHGFRASAITMIQEQLSCPKHLPDLQAGHKLRDNNGEAYSRVKFLDERTEMMQAWADYLDELRTTEESS